MEKQVKQKKEGRRSTLKLVEDYVIITLGLLCYTAGWCIFVLPNNLVGGGVSGIGAIIQYATGGLIPVSYTFFGLNIILLLIGIRMLGKGFGIKTVYGIVVASLFLRVLPEIIPQEFIAEISLKNTKLLAAIIGGCMSGLGIGITFSRGGSTGGTDIVALIVNKFWNVSPGKVIMMCDALIVGSSIFLPSQEGIGARIANVTYGYIIVAAASYMVDLLVSGNKHSVQLFIFSKQYEQIADMIMKDMGRGVTVLDAKGWYTKQDEKLLLVIVRKYEAGLLLSMIKNIDKQAFISVGNVMGVYGRGFEMIKEKRKLAKS